MEFDLKLDAAIRSAFAQSGVRLAPEAKTSEIVEQLAEYGVSASVDNGALSLSQNGSIISNGTAVAGFVKQRPEHFVIDGGQARSLADFRPADTTEGKKQRVEFIREHGGEKFAQLVNAPNLRPGVVANREISKADWNNLTTREKSAAITADPEIVSIIHGRK